MNEEYLFYRAGRLANFLASPAPATEFFQAAPAPYFFPKRLRLLAFFFRAAPAARGQKHPAPAPWQHILFPQTTKKYKTSNNCFFNHKT